MNEQKAVQGKLISEAKVLTSDKRAWNADLIWLETLIAPRHQNKKYENSKLNKKEDLSSNFNH